jgi:hypothetical protein
MRYGYGRGPSQARCRMGGSYAHRFKAVLRGFLQRRAVTAIAPALKSPVKPRERTIRGIAVKRARLVLLRMKNPRRGLGVPVLVAGMPAENRVSSLEEGTDDHFYFVEPRCTGIPSGALGAAISPLIRGLNGGVGGVPAANRRILSRGLKLR